VFCVSLLFIALWVVLASANAYYDWPPASEYETLSAYLQDTALFALLPPTILVAFGYCVVWTTRGFRRTQRAAKIYS